MADEAADQLGSLRSRGRKRRRKLRPGTRPARNTNGHTGGHPAFVPTETEKAFVSAMAGVRMTWDEICHVLGSARNGPDRGKKAGAPLAKTTLLKHFKNELAAGSALLRAKTVGKFYQALDAGESWAVAMSMRNRFGWDPAKYGTLIGPPEAGDVRPLQEIVFVVPGFSGSEREAEAEAETRPERLLPPPQQLRKNEFGVWEEFSGSGGGTSSRPPKPGDWMA